MRYFKKMIGERIYLSPLNPDDAEVCLKWLNDPELAEYTLVYRKAYSFANERQALERMSTEHNYAIVLSEGDVYIGNLSLMGMNHIDRCASLGITIGEPEHRGKGYGAEAIHLIVDYAFGTLNLHSVELGVLATNERAIACYKKCGFVEYGRLKEGRYIKGRYVDEVLMQIISDR
ncbi:MAG: GNAT family N-acetyltransferase [Oscillospiraceae bacterium]|jgi:RimJ/RimL family protein N-acetyltransferase|nr:GNAT family N-acetyltransferase [Oscillospiraceae bacterium]